MKDMINAFRAHLYERTSSPFIGPFIFYWLICNYKLIMIIFDGDMKLNEKFDLIKALYPLKDPFTLWEGFNIHYSILLGNVLLIPLIITLVYIFITPYPSKFIYQFWKTKQREIQEIKQKIDDETPLTKQQSKKIKQDFFTLEEKYNELLDKNSRLNKEIKELKLNASNKSNAPNNFEELILSELIKRPNDRVGLAHSLKILSKEEVNNYDVNNYVEKLSSLDFALENLVSKKLIFKNTKSSKGIDPYIYEPTDEGTRYFK